MREPFLLTMSEVNIIPPDTLLSGYAQGIFPMADSRDADGVEWYSANARGIIPIDQFHVSKNVHRFIRQNKFEVRINTCFRDVIEACSERETTWINDLIIHSYTYLNQLGYAQSVEVFQDQCLVGGLYGVTLGSAFFGETMFKKAKEADKVALYYCHQILKNNGFTLWDTQFYTDHLSQFGCVEIEPDEYQILLQKALDNDAAFKLTK